MASESTNLAVQRRDPGGSRATRRLRRTGQVPGIVYGGGQEPEPVAVDARVLRVALASRGAVLEVSVDGGPGQAVVVKDEQRDALRGDTTHIDLLRVRLDRPIEATVTLELHGAEDAPGTREGGVIEQPTRELTVSALPTSIPDVLVHDVSGMGVGDTRHLSDFTPPPGVELVDDPETIIASCTIPVLDTDEDIEQETELVGENEAPDAELQAEALSDAAESGGSAGDVSGPGGGDAV